MTTVKVPGTGAAVAAVFIVLPLALGGGALGAATGQVTITEYPFPTLGGRSPDQVASGPDGNVWFTTSVGRLGRISATGAITEFPLDAQPGGVAGGPDGNVWFTANDASKIGRITPAGAVTQFATPTAASHPLGITRGPDGNLWFTEYTANKIGRITPAGTITEFLVPTANAYPMRITSGPDGNLWFSELGAAKIGRITPSGEISEFSEPVSGDTPSGQLIGPWDITAGPDGRLWFTVRAGRVVGAITTSGVVTIYPQPGSGAYPLRYNPRGIAVGGDGNLWITRDIGVERLTPAGTFTGGFTTPTSSSGPEGITRHTDGNLWFAEWAADKIAKAVLTPPPAVCSDGLDNDGDGMTDYPADAGCASAGDDDERGSELLKNAGFELDGNGDGRPDNWTSSSRFTRTTTVTAVGGYAGRHRASDDASYTIKQSIDTQAGRTYRFAGQVSVPPTADSFTFRLQVRWRNASGATISTKTIKTYAGATSGWDRAQASLQAPAGASTAHVRMVAGSLKATIYVDDFSFAIA